MMLFALLLAAFVWNVQSLDLSLGLSLQAFWWDTGTQTNVLVLDRRFIFF